MSQPVISPTPVRRIVTKHDAEGNSMVGVDSLIYPQYDSGFNLDIGKIWATDPIPSKDNNLDIDGATRPLKRIVSPGGVTCLYADLAPGQTVPMHRSSSVDFNILVAGELILIAEDGEHHMKNPGDIFVQRGTLHGWKNPTTTWARWIAVIMDAEPAKIDSEHLPDVL